MGIASDYHIKHRISFMEFDVTEARGLTAGRRRVRVKVEEQWNALVKIYPDQLKVVDMTEPVIVAIVHFPKTNETIPMLIDGHHRMQRAVDEGLAELEAVFLDAKETERIITRLPE